LVTQGKVEAGGMEKDYPQGEVQTSGRKVSMGSEKKKRREKYRECDDRGGRMEKKSTVTKKKEPPIHINGEGKQGSQKEKNAKRRRRLGANKVEGARFFKMKR